MRAHPDLRKADPRPQAEVASQCEPQFEHQRVDSIDLERQVLNMSPAPANKNEPISFEMGVFDS